LSSVERIARIGEIEARLLACEAREEALSTLAAEAGTEILRRPEANPLCVLGIAIAAQAAQAVA
jgi:hypothetical protein